jgi:lactoylglutathione lyase
MKILAEAIREVHPVYYVRDIQRSVAFYRDVLGLELAWRFSETIAAVRVTEGFLIVLCEDADRARATAIPALVLAVEQIDEVYRALAERGVAFAGPIEDRPYGRIATFTDPDGYTYDLCG